MRPRRPPDDVSRYRSPRRCSPDPGRLCCNDRMTRSGGPAAPGWPGQQPPSGRPAPAIASPPPRRGAAGVWWGVLGGAGLVVLAAAVLTLTGVITWGFSVTAGTAGTPATGPPTSGAAVDTRPVEMPDRAG